MSRKNDLKAASSPTSAITPLAMVGATWLATKLAQGVYQGVTGKDIPAAEDPEEKILNIALWTAVLTGAVTLAEVLVNRLFNQKN